MPSSTPRCRQTYAILRRRRHYAASRCHEADNRHIAEMDEPPTYALYIYWAFLLIIFIETYHECRYDRRIRHLFSNIIYYHARHYWGFLFSSSYLWNTPSHIFNEKRLNIFYFLLSHIDYYAAYHQLLSSHTMLSIFTIEIFSFSIHLVIT